MQCEALSKMTLIYFCYFVDIKTAIELLDALSESELKFYILKLKGSQKPPC